MENCNTKYSDFRGNAPMLPEEIGLTVIKMGELFYIKTYFEFRGKYMRDFLKNDDQKAFISFLIGAALWGGHISLHVSKSISHFSNFLSISLFGCTGSWLQHVSLAALWHMGS